MQHKISHAQITATKWQKDKWLYHRITSTLNHAIKFNTSYLSSCLTTTSIKTHSWYDIKLHSSHIWILTVITRFIRVFPSVFFTIIFLWFLLKDIEWILRLICVTFTGVWICILWTCCFSTSPFIICKIMEIPYWCLYAADPTSLSLSLALFHDT